MTRHFLAAIAACATLLLSAIGLEQSRGQGFFILASAASVSCDTSINTSTCLTPGANTPFTSLFSVTRASPEACTDASGNITTVGNNLPCITSAGWGSTWEARTNIVTQSNTFTNAAWTKTGSTVATDGTLGPDGALAYKLTATAGNSNHDTFSVVATATGAGQNYTLSVYTKAGTLPYVYLSCVQAATEWYGAVFDLSSPLNTTASQTSQSTTPSANLIATRQQNFSNGYSLISITGNVAGTNCFPVAGIAPAATGNVFNSSSGGRATWTAAGTETAYFFQYDLQLGSTVGPPITTTTAPVTRAADNVVPIGQLATLIASSTATVAIETSNAQSSVAGTLIDSNGTVLLGKNATDYGITAVGAALTTRYSGTWSGITDLTLAWTATGGILQLNGGAISADTVARTPSSTLHVFSTGGSSAFLNGNVTKITVTAKKLPLQAGPLVALNNYQIQATTDKTTQVSHHSDDGSIVDARAGNIQQFGSKFYLYGESDACGFTPGTVGPWCGIKVYSSPTLYGLWHYEGLLYDPAPFQGVCASASGENGCYSPKVIYNAANNNYVVWVYNLTAATTSLQYVFTCTTPTGGATPSTPGTGCTQQANATYSGAGIGGANPLTPSLFSDPSNGNGYVVFSTTSSFNVWVAALNSTYTDTTGAAVNTGGVGEAEFGFIRNGVTYIGFGTAGCSYCATASTFYRSAATPLGTYGSSVTINSTTSCQSQPMDAFTMTLNGQTSYIAVFDQWWSQVSDNRINQGFANIYFQPLSFTGSAINPFTCQQFVTIPGMASASPPVSPLSTPDQNDFADFFQDWCDITSSVFRMQTFVPQKSVVTSVALPLGKNNATCAIGTTCASPDGSLTVALVTLDGSNNPVSTLASSVIPAASVNWATTWTTLTFNQSVTPGTAYGVRISGSNTVGCYGTSFNQAGPQPYPNGVERISSNAGSTYTTEAGRSFMFSTN